jgi:hypothetical protein
MEIFRKCADLSLVVVPLPLLFSPKPMKKSPIVVWLALVGIILSHVRRGFNPALVQPHLAPNNICLITVSWSFFACPLEH